MITKSNRLLLWLRTLALVAFIVMASTITVELLKDSRGRILGIAPAPCSALGLPVERIDDPVPLMPKPGEKNAEETPAVRPQ